jgi:hypothetical protein
LRASLFASEQSNILTLLTLVYRQVSGRSPPAPALTGSRDLVSVFERGDGAALVGGLVEPEGTRERAADAEVMREPPPAPLRGPPVDPGMVMMAMSGASFGRDHGQGEQDHRQNRDDELPHRFCFSG